jgi:hypothetical protein
MQRGRPAGVIAASGSRLAPGSPERLIHCGANTVMSFT